MQVQSSNVEGLWCLNSVARDLETGGDKVACRAETRMGAMTR